MRETPLGSPALFVRLVEVLESRWLARGGSGYSSVQKMPAGIGASNGEAVLTGLQSCAERAGTGQDGRDGVTELEPWNKRIVMNRTVGLLSRYT